ncbi:MAG: hypothetical protein ACI4QC_10110 [Thermoguttaceae bacterium]
MSTTIYKQITGSLAVLLLVLGLGSAAHAWDRVKPSPVTVETSVGEDNWVAVKAEPDLEIYGEESPEAIDDSILTLDEADVEAVETEDSIDVDSWFDSEESADSEAVEETVDVEIDEAISLDVDDWFESTESEAGSVIEEIADDEPDADSLTLDLEETVGAVSVGELGLEDGVVDLDETSVETVREEESGAALVPVSNLGDAITVAPGFAALDVAAEDEPAPEETPAEEPVIEEQIAKESLIEADSEKTDDPAPEETPAEEPVIEEQIAKESLIEADSEKTEEPAAETPALETAAEEPKAEEPAADASAETQDGVAVSGEPQAPQIATSEWTAAQSSVGDQVWIVMATADGFYCQTLENNAWRVADVKEFYAGDSADRSTVIWAHGFKTDMTGAAESGCSFRNTIDAARAAAGSTRAYRLVIWKWSSERSAGRLRIDAQMKGRIADAEGRRLANFIGGMNASNNVSLVGFSFGARVVGSALQCLATVPSTYMTNRTGRVSLVLASSACDYGAFDWNYANGAAIPAYVLNIYNPADFALRYYPFISDTGSQAQGVYPITGSAFTGAVGSAFNINVSGAVGKEHSFTDEIQAVPCSVLIDALF